MPIIKNKVNMDIKKLGEHIVNEILNTYLQSDDFSKDALHYAYKKVYDEYNSIIAQIGYDILHNRISQEEFMNKMEEYTNELNTFRKAFDRIFKYSPDYENIVGIGYKTN